MPYRLLAHQRGVPYTNDEDMKARALEWRLDPVVKKLGVAGVCLWDCPEGAHRMRRGRKHSTTKETTHRMKDDTTAEDMDNDFKKNAQDLHHAMGSKRGGAASGSMMRATTAEEDEIEFGDAATPGTTAPTALDSLSCTGSTHPAAEGGTPYAKSVQSRKAASESGLKVTPPAKSKRSTAASSIGSAKGDDDEEDDEEQEDDDDEEQQKGDGQAARRKKGKSLLQKCQDLLTTTREQFSWKGLWADCVKRRVDDRVKSLRANGRKSGKHLDKKPLLATRTEIWREVEHVETIYEIMKLFKSTPIELLGPVNRA